MLPLPSCLEVMLTVEQKTNLDGWPKPGELVDMRASAADLSLHDRRLFNVLVMNAWAEITEDKMHRIPMALVRGTHHKGAAIVADSVRALMTSLVEIPLKLDGEPAIYTTQLLGETTRCVDESSSTAVLQYEFPKGLRRIIKDSRYWGRIKAHVMFAFKTKYALALYEALCLRANLQVHEQAFGVEEFRSLLGVPAGKIPLYRNLKQRVLDPAVVEVNGLSDFNVEVEPIRIGGMQRGKLTGFRLAWSKKPTEEWRAVADELLRSKVGRSARIRGTVVSVS